MQISMNSEKESILKVGRCIVNIHDGVDTNSQWGQAVVLLNKMSNLNVAQTWIEIASKLKSTKKPEFE